MGRYLACAKAHPAEDGVHSISRPGSVMLDERREEQWLSAHDLPKRGKEGERPTGERHRARAARLHALGTNAPDRRAAVDLAPFRLPKLIGRTSMRGEEAGAYRVTGCPDWPLTVRRSSPARFGSSRATRLLQLRTATPDGPRRRLFRWRGGTPGLRRRGCSAPFRITRRTRRLRTPKSSCGSIRSISFYPSLGSSPFRAQRS